MKLQECISCIETVFLNYFQAVRHPDPDNEECTVIRSFDAALTQYFQFR